jgi:hypothetical protein
MTQFSPSDAALEGFRITRERPRALMIWAVFCFAVSIASVLISLMMPPEARAALEELQKNPGQPPTAEALLSTLIVLSPILLFGLAVQCVMAAAVYRIMLRPGDSRYGYLRLGRSELRLMALTLIYLVLGIVLLAAVQIAVGLVVVLASFAGEMAMGFVFSAVQLFALGLIFFVAIRMSLAPVITFNLGRLAIFDSWALTRGQFWRLLGAYVLAICCVIVVALLVLLIFGALALLAMMAAGGDMSDLTVALQPAEATLAVYLNPFMVAYMAVGSVFTAIYYAVIAAPGAWAYRELSRDVPPMERGAATA